MVLFFRLESEHLFKMKIPKFYKIDIPQMYRKIIFLLINLMVYLSYFFFPDFFGCIVSKLVLYFIIIFLKNC